jgi:transcriptional regulator GlxA family with amidase domain
MAGESALASMYYQEMQSEFVEVKLIKSIVESQSEGARFVVLTDSGMTAFADVGQAEACAQDLTEPFAVVEVLRTGGPIESSCGTKRKISEADAKL